MISSFAHLSYPLGVCVCEMLPYLFYKAFILCAQFHEHLRVCVCVLARKKVTAVGSAHWQKKSKEKEEKEETTRK